MVDVLYRITRMYALCTYPMARKIVCASWMGTGGNETWARSSLHPHLCLSLSEFAELFAVNLFLDRQV